MSKPLVYNYATAEAKIQKQAEEIIRLKEENTNLRIKCRILEADLDALQGGDAQMNPIPNGTGVMQETPSEDGSDLISRADAMGAVQDHFNANGFKGYDDGQKMMDRIKSLPSADADFADLPDIPRAYYERIVGNMAHEINMLKEQLESADAESDDLIIKGAKGIKDGLYNITDGKLFMYKANGGTVRTYPIVSSADAVHGEWIPCGKRLPSEDEIVNITWVNHNPPPYYADIAEKPFVASGLRYRDKWYWYSSVCQDLHQDFDLIDKDIEVIAWQPLPKPHKGGDDE